MFPVEPNADAAAAFDAALCRELRGGNVYSVGGRVRDEVLAELGRSPQTTLDLDYLVTGLSLQDMLARLSARGRAELVGAAFGVIKFTLDGITADVALPRRERSTGSHHRDFRVEFAPDIPLEADLARRDFRINMMARELKNGRLVDPYGGRSDLEAKNLDILAPDTFVEDPLRILRGAQLAARFELTPTQRTVDAMRSAAHLLSTVAPERVADELTKLLEKASRPSLGIDLLRHVGGLSAVLPEVAEGWEVDQNQYHAYSVYYHSLYCCDAAPRELVVRLAALFHDVGKPRTKAGPHFYNHQFVGADMTRAALSRLRFPNDLVDRVCQLVSQHMYSAGDELTDAAVRRFIRRVGPGNVGELFALRHADVAATGLEPRAELENARFEARVRREMEGPHALSLADLAIRGEDVIAIMRDAGIVDANFRGDRRVGEALQRCLDRVLDDPSHNEPTALRAVVREFLNIERKT